MNWPMATNKQFALVSSGNRTILAEKQNKIKKDGQEIQIIANGQEGLDNREVIHAMLAHQKTKKGEVSISLPLNHFEVVNLAINKVPDEAIAKVIPYHLSKSLQESSSDFIYDWQITKRKKDSIAISVIIYPQKAYQQLNNSLGKYKLSCKRLEPDLYSAAIFLEHRQIINPKSVTIIMLVWRNSISIGVYNQGDFVLLRTIAISQPNSPFPSMSSDQSQSDPNQKQII